MNLPDKIEYIELKSIVVDDKTVQIMTNDSALTVMTAINQLIYYLAEKEEPKEDYSQAFNNFMGGDPEESLEKLTIRKQL